MLDPDPYPKSNTDPEPGGDLNKGPFGSESETLGVLKRQANGDTR